MAQVSGGDTPEQDGLRRSIEKLVDNYRKGFITSDELGELVWRLLGRLPVEARLAGLGPLVAGDDQVRTVGDTMLTLCRNEVLSRDLDFVRQYSPLGPGVRINVAGGLDECQSGGFGARQRSGVFLRFARALPDQIPIALVEFDGVVPGGGRYGALIGGFGRDYPAWVFPEINSWVPSVQVGVHLLTAIPDDWELGGDFFPWQVAHARLTVTGGREIKRWDVNAAPYIEGLTPQAVLHAALDSADGRTWWNAAARLGEWGDGVAIERLTRVLRDSRKSSSERADAAYALGRSRSSGNDIADAIASVLDEHEPDAVRQEAAVALTRVLSSVEALQAWLDSQRLDDLTRKLQHVCAGLPATRDLLQRSLVMLDDSTSPDQSERSSGEWRRLRIDAQAALLRGGPLKKR